jgi:hypothetical protein
MNTFTRLSFAAVAAALLVTDLCFAACSQKTQNQLGTKNDDKKFCLKIGHPKRSIYADVRNQDDFNKALSGLSKEAEYNITYVCKEGDPVQNNYVPANATPCPKGTESSQSGGTRRTAAGDPNATQKIRSPNPQELAAVLTTFATPAPSAAR